MTSAADLDLLSRWFSDLKFVHHWGGKAIPREKLERDYIGANERTPDDGAREWVHSFIIESGATPVGYIQAWRTPPEAGGIDIVIAPEFQGQGLGPDAILALTSYLHEERDWETVTVDPAAGNLRARRTFEKCGFIVERDWPDHPDGPSVLMVHRTTR
ncbi:MAG: GNAT family N-acetyltransferase [Candidatus Eremiobacteraeota bacterium]|nr:GNAT family N-acetyltransferase [Candidatus Eremiobacteraeota bacterium]